MSQKTSSDAGGAKASPTSHRRGRPPRLEVRPHQKPLRVTERDEALLAALRPFMSGINSDSEQVYTLVREGMIMRLAALAALGVSLSEDDEDLLAVYAAQQLLLIVPLLRRTGKLALLGMEVGTMVVTAGGTPPEQEEQDDGGFLDLDDLGSQAGRDAGGLSGGLI